MTDEKLKLVHGRELNDNELNQAIPAIILNEEAFNKLFNGWESNLYADIKGKPYKIVGVYETKMISEWLWRKVIHRLKMLLSFLE